MVSDQQRDTSSFLFFLGAIPCCCCCCCCCGRVVTFIGSRRFTDPTTSTKQPWTRRGEIRGNKTGHLKIHLKRRRRRRRRKKSLSECIELSNTFVWRKNDGKLRVIVVPLFASAKLCRTIKKKWQVTSHPARPGIIRSGWRETARPLQQEEEEIPSEMNFLKLIMQRWGVFFFQPTNQWGEKWVSYIPTVFYYYYNTLLYAL